MKKIILTSLAIFGLPLFAFANDATNTTTLPALGEIESETVELNMQPNNDDIQMHCVWTSCTGTVCEEIFSNERVAIEFIEEFDNCYD